MPLNLYTLPIVIRTYLLQRDIKKEAHAQALIGPVAILVLSILWDMENFGAEADVASKLARARQAS